jgi:hypothetical protein
MDEEEENLSASLFISQNNKTSASFSRLINTIID